MDLYQEAGVNIDAGTETVRRIKGLVRSTFNSRVLGDLGSFGGLYAFPNRDYQNPVLVSSSDGVGTKLKVACQMRKYDTVGTDLVNHCVNDILVQGARPLFFLDYIGTGFLEPEVAEAVVGGLAAGCRENECVLIGGETAEMPGLYARGDFDLVGTIVGVVEKDKLITGNSIQAGDLVIGLPSLGLHTNGYSLARKICFEKLGLNPESPVAGLPQSIGLELLAPHRSYFQAVYPLANRGLLKGIAHLTGGGFYDNIPRILPQNCGVQITKATWPVLPLFEFLQAAGEIPDDQAYRVFNMGIGMVLVIHPTDYETVKASLSESSMQSYLIGTVIAGERKVVLL